MSDKSKKIRVGFTERHGMTAEQAQFPPPGIEYCFPPMIRKGSALFKSPIKGYMSDFNLSGCDIVESVISPIKTDIPWIYSLACYQEALAFDIYGLPSPRIVKNQLMGRLLKQENCKRLLFWSEAGKQTLKSYGGVVDPDIWRKSVVIYPGIRDVKPELIQFNANKVNILFSGDFFRKGGANVIDAFEVAQKSFPNADLKLRVCCDESIDFNTSDLVLRQQYIDRIKANPNIIFGRVPRDKMINEILPETDIYLLPTYNETFGFAVLEAMAFGIPVISTRHMAIPEMITEGESGYLIDLGGYDTERMFRGYVVNSIPTEFHKLISRQLSEKLCNLIESAPLRHRMGMTGIDITRQKFSFDARNEQMSVIYQESVA